MDAPHKIVYEHNHNGLHIFQFKASDINILSYYIESDGQGLLIDPVFDCEIYQTLIKVRSATLKYVGITKIHTDYIGSHPQLGVPVVMSEQTKVQQETNFEIMAIKENQSFSVGKVSIKVFSTPGPTSESCSFLVHDGQGKPYALFSGDLIFVNDISRSHSNNQEEIKELTSKYYDSLEKIKKIDPKVTIYPNHCAGFEFGKNIGAGNFTTVEKQLKDNFAFQFKNKEQFVEKLLNDQVSSGLSKFWEFIKQKNIYYETKHSHLLEAGTKALTVDQFQELSSKFAIIDTRHNNGQGLIEKSYWMTQKGDITKWMCFNYNPATQFLLVCDVGHEIQVLNRLLRVGFWGCVGVNGFEMKEWKGKLNKIQTTTLQGVIDIKGFHVDCRNPGEWQKTGIFPDALLIPLPQFQKRVQEVAESKQYKQGFIPIVNCRSAMRARLAASIMMQANIHPIVLQQKFDQLKGKGAKLVQWKKE